MDLLETLPDFPTKAHAHILPFLEKAKITVKELLLLDPLEVAKQARVPVTDVRKCKAHILESLHQDLGLDRLHRTEETRLKDKIHKSNRPVEQDRECRSLRPPVLSRISTLDPVLDEALAGGISTSYVTELTGESGTGKTQLLLHLLLSVQLPQPNGLSKKALYISTESDLPTNRLSQLLTEHTSLLALPPDTQPPSLENILSITTADLESQDHIINYQVPVAVSRYNIGLVIIDSITANYRVESSVDTVPGLLKRSWKLKKLGHLLRTLAVKHNIAVVVANQVSDKLDDSALDDPSLLMEELSNLPKTGLEEQSSQFDDSSLPLPPPSSSVPPQSSPAPYSHLNEPPLFHSSPEPGSRRYSQFPPSSLPQPDDGTQGDVLDLKVPNLGSILTIEHQQPFFTGWGDPPSNTIFRSPHPPGGLKTPALGLVWTNQIGCRIVLKVHHDVLSTHHIDERNTEAVASSMQSNHPPNGPNSNSDMLKVKLDQDVRDTPEEKSTTHQLYPNPTPDHDPDPDPGPSPAIKQIHTDSTAHIPQQRRRLRQMQIVFSPWTSGEPHRQTQTQTRLDSNTNPNEDRHIPSEFDSMYDPVEFEISPQGIRGVLPKYP